MHVMITGAAGMLGRKLAGSLAAGAPVMGSAVDRLSLVDTIPAPIPAGLLEDSNVRVCDLAGAGVATSLVDGRPDIIFHLAAIVSGEAEADFDLGYRVNLDGTRHLFDAIRLEAIKAPYRPRVIFASSIAVFGGPYPARIPDDFLPAPLTSYGTQKAICELLLSDYTRRGILDGVGLRLPTLCIRPGEPNKAASGFFSNILREPLAGKEAVLPVDESVRHWFASPRAAVGFVLHAANLDTAAVGPRRNITMPGLSATVAEEIEALRRFGGEKAVGLIRRELDEKIQSIVSGWPSDFEARRAKELGFQADMDFDAIVRCHLEDD